MRSSRVIAFDWRDRRGTRRIIRLALVRAKINAAAANRSIETANSTWNLAVNGIACRHRRSHPSGETRARARVGFVFPSKLCGTSF